jgi:hypothetical protein
MKAVALATQVRVQQAEMKRLIADGTLAPYTVLAGHSDEWEPWARRARIRQVLLAVPGLGPATVQEVLDRLGATTTTRLGALTWQGRKELADLVASLTGTIPVADLVRDADAS